MGCQYRCVQVGACRQLCVCVCRRRWDCASDRPGVGSFVCASTETRRPRVSEQPSRPIVTLGRRLKKDTHDGQHSDTLKQAGIAKQRQKANLHDVYNQASGTTFHTSSSPLPEPRTAVQLGPPPPANLTMQRKPHVQPDPAPNPQKASSSPSPW